MDSRELAELERLMKKASEAGLMDGGKMQSTLTQGGGKAQSISSPGAVTGAMTDACKRRKNEPEELSSDSEWDAAVGRSSDSPAIDDQARYVTEGDTVSAKPRKGVADFKEWSQTVIAMDKYADMNWSFSELIAASEGDAKITRYITWIVGTYATPAVKDPQNQAEDFGMYARACGWKPKPKGYQRKTK
eukprot:symbB.v1.2.040860.t1/scaffold7602.1/size10339/1